MSSHASSALFLLFLALVGATFYEMPATDDFHSNAKVAKVEARVKQLQNKIDAFQTPVEPPGMTEAQDADLTKVLNDAKDIEMLSNGVGANRLSILQLQQAYNNAEIERFNNDFKAYRAMAKAKMLKHSTFEPPSIPLNADSPNKETSEQKALRKKYYALKQKKYARDLEAARSKGLDFTKTKEPSYSPPGTTTDAETQHYLTKIQNRLAHIEQLEKIQAHNRIKK